MREPLYLRGNIWWCRVRRPEGGRRKPESTGCRDYKAAVLRWRELERLSVLRPHPPENTTSLAEALDQRHDERRSAGRAAGTLDMLKRKARHVTRILGGCTPLSRIGAAEVDAFIATRLEEGAARTTVHKELVTLRGALRLARRRGLYSKSLEEVMPLDFSIKYKPRTRALSEKECEKLLEALPPKRAAIVAFILATGATYPSEVASVRRSNVDTKAWMVHLPGTKRERRDRKVPIVSFARGWLTYALKHATGDGRLFEPWSNVRRDLLLACESAKIAAVSPNDLRRTLATLLRARGVEPHLIGQVLGHADSRMVERVYGRINPEQLSGLLDAKLAGYSRVTEQKNASKRSASR